ncbi:MAG: hypothetical protein LQ348_002836 [Seirophora lacunosa]|nr:MAG: hypothetical protein LQ348_002836 [Seirophora lacunosa]
MCASIQNGECSEQGSGLKFIQRKKYYNGIGSDDDIKLVRRMESGAFGSGFSDQIREVYKGTAHQDVYGSADLESAGLTRKAPKIQFVGVFDTVKALRDHRLYDTSFNDSIQHLRHALALDENRRAFRPEFQTSDACPSPDEVLFRHVESRAKGLQLEFDGSFGNRAVIDDPLKLVFPAYESEGKGVPLLTFTAKNDLKVEMQDLRRVHQLPKHGAKYAVHLNQYKRLWMPNEQRAAFNEDGNLRCYCEYATQGTIIHPSVYLILDVFSTLFLSSEARSFRNRIEGFRDTILTKDVFWEEKAIIDDAKPGAIRILVCGNTGIGKSTLINEVFGAERQLQNGFEAEAEAYANEELQKRVIQIEQDLSDIKDSRCDAVLNNGVDDKESIKVLAEETARYFDHEKVRMLYVAAQVARIDLKVDLATTKTMQIYKRVVKSAGGTSLIPMATTTSRVTVGAVVCTAVVNAFGVPSVTAATVRQIVKSIIWDDLGGNFKVFLAECIAAAGIVRTIGLFGMPVFLAAGALTAPVAIVATAELLLMLSCDLILVLRRAFKDCTHQSLGHPLKKNIEKAALAYREFAPGVHKEIKILTPSSTKFYQAFKSAKIKMGFEQIIEKYTQSFVEQSDVGSSSRHGSVQGSLESRVSSPDLRKAQSTTNPLGWPPVPFQVPLLRRKGQQSIVITRNNRRDYGPDARELAKKVCARMTTWITTLPHGSAIDEPHWEKESYGEVHAREFTIWMQLVPKDTSGRVKLDRELAYFAMNEYCNLVAVYGAMRGEFEYRGFETVLAVTVIHVIQWPKIKAAGSTA